MSSVSSHSARKRAAANASRQSTLAEHWLAAATVGSEDIVSLVATVDCATSQLAACAQRPTLCAPPAAPVVVTTPAACDRGGTGSQMPVPVLVSADCSLRPGNVRTIASPQTLINSTGRTVKARRSRVHPACPYTRLSASVLSQHNAACGTPSAPQTKSGILSSTKSCVSYADSCNANIASFSAHSVSAACTARSRGTDEHKSLPGTHGDTESLSSLRDTGDVVQRSSRLATYRASLCGHIEKTQHDMIEQYRNEGMRVLIHTRRQHAAAGTAKHGGTRRQTKEETRVLSLRSNSVFDCKPASEMPIFWACNPWQQPRHQRQVFQLFVENSRAQARNLISIPGAAGAAMQVCDERVPHEKLSRAVAGQVVAIEMQMAMLRHELRRRGRLVVPATGTQCFAPSAVLSGLCPNASFALFTCSPLSVYCNKPANIGCNHIRAVAARLALQEDTAAVLSNGLVPVVPELSMFCDSVLQRRGAPFDPLWASLLLVVHLAQHPRGMRILQSVGLSSSDFYTCILVEWYGRAEVNRRLNQHIKQARSKRPRAAAASLPADIASLESKLLPGCKSSGTVSDLSQLLRRWALVLSCDLVSNLLATLLSHRPETTQMAVMQTLRQQVTGVVSKEARLTAEQHAEATRSRMVSMLLHAADTPEVCHVLTRVPTTAAAGKLERTLPDACLPALSSATFTVMHGIAYSSTIAQLEHTAVYALEVRRNGIDACTPPVGSGIAIMHVLASAPVPVDRCSTKHVAGFAERLQCITVDAQRRRGVYRVAGGGNACRQAARYSQAVDIAACDHQHKRLPTAATGLTRSLIVQRYVVTRAVTNTKLADVQHELAREHACNAVADSHVASKLAQHPVLDLGRGGISCSSDAVTPLPVCGYANFALQLRIQERIEFARSRGMMRLEKPARAQLVGSLQKAQPVCSADRPLPLLTVTDIDFEVEPVLPSQIAPVADTEIGVIVTRQVNAARATRLCDVLQKLLCVRDQKSTHTATAPPPAVFAATADLKEHTTAGSATLHRVPHAGRSTKQHDLLALLFAGASTASFINDMGMATAQETFLHSVATCGRATTVDRSALPLNTCDDAVVGQRMGLHTMCAGLYEGVYQAFDTGRMPMGFNAQTHFADGRQHGGVVLDPLVAQQAAPLFVQAQCVPLSDTDTHAVVATPPEVSSGEPLYMYTRLHSCLNTLTSALDSLHFGLFGLNGNSGQTAVMVPSVGVYGQQLDVHVDRCSKELWEAHFMRQDAEAKIVDAQMPFSDATAPAYALFRMPMFKGSDKLDWTSGPADSPLPYASTFLEAACVVARIASFIGGARASARESVDMLYRSMRAFHELEKTPDPATYTAAAVPPAEEWMYPVAALILLTGVMYPCTHGINVKTVPAPYALAYPEMARLVYAYVVRGEDVGTGRHGLVLADCFASSPTAERRTQVANARSVFAAYDGSRPGPSAWDRVADLLVQLLQRNGRAGAGRADIAALRTCIEKAVTAAAIVYSPDGTSPPLPPCPCAGFVYQSDSRLMNAHIKQKFVGDATGPARRALIGLHQFQFRSILLLLLGAHVADEVNVYGQEGQMLLRISSDATIRDRHGRPRSSKQISCVQTEKDMLGSRDEREAVCTAQRAAWNNNFKLLLPLYTALESPVAKTLRMLGHVGLTETARREVQEAALAEAEDTLYEQNAKHFFNEAAKSELNLESIEVLHRRAAATATD